MLVPGGFPVGLIHRPLVPLDPDGLRKPIPQVPRKEARAAVRIDEVRRSAAAGRRQQPFHEGEQLPGSPVIGLEKTALVARISPEGAMPLLSPGSRPEPR